MPCLSKIRRKKPLSHAKKRAFSPSPNSDPAYARRRFANTCILLLSLRTKKERDAPSLFFCRFYFVSSFAKTIASL